MYSCLVSDDFVNNMRRNVLSTCQDMQLLMYGSYRIFMWKNNYHTAKMTSHEIPTQKYSILKHKTRTAAIPKQIGWRHSSHCWHFVCWIYSPDSWSHRINIAQRKSGFDADRNPKFSVWVSFVSSCEIWSHCTERQDPLYSPWFRSTLELYFR